MRPMYKKFLPYKMQGEHNILRKSKKKLNRTGERNQRGH